MEAPKTVLRDDRASISKSRMPVTSASIRSSALQAQKTVFRAYRVTGLGSQRLATQGGTRTFAVQDGIAGR